jgi:hypothetical protein
MTAALLLREAEAGRIKLRLAAHEVRWRAGGDPSPELLDKLRAHKAEVVELLERRDGTRCRRCGECLDYQNDWSTRAFADGSGACGDCYYTEAAERAARDTTNRDTRASS